MAVLPLRQCPHIRVRPPQCQGLPRSSEDNQFGTHLAHNVTVWCALCILLGRNPNKYVILIVVSFLPVLSISESNFIASGVFSSIFLALGMFESYLLGFLFHWRTMCFILSSQVNMVDMVLMFSNIICHSASSDGTCIVLRQRISLLACLQR